MYQGLNQGRLAQLGEHLVYTERVGGSSPSSPTILPMNGLQTQCLSRSYKVEVAFTTVFFSISSEANCELEVGGTLAGAKCASQMEIERKTEAHNYVSLMAGLHSRHKFFKMKLHKPLYNKKAVQLFLRPSMDTVLHA